MQQEQQEKLLIRLLSQGALPIKDLRWVGVPSVQRKVRSRPKLLSQLLSEPLLLLLHQQPNVRRQGWLLLGNLLSTTCYWDELLQWRLFWKWRVRNWKSRISQSRLGLKLASLSKHHSVDFLLLFASYSLLNPLTAKSFSIPRYGNSEHPFQNALRTPRQTSSFRW